MKLNQKINKNIPYICAKLGKKFAIEHKGNTITFIVSKYSYTFNVYRTVSSTLLKLAGKSITFDLSSFLKLVEPKYKFCLATALLARVDAFNEPSFSLKTKENKFEANILVNNVDKKDVKRAIDILNGIHLARQFQILPANYLGIKDFALQAKALLEQLKNKHLKVKVLGLDQIKKEKMGLLQAVNAGSDEPAKMVVIEYKNSSNKNLLALVGKGIMFDAGGYELKPSMAMTAMNQDMTGAATVFGTIYALAKTNAKVNVIGLLPLAKNLINSHSMQVSDVYKACNGRSVEIVSPDAEGRLILADAIAYANKKYPITKLFTVATLTGLSQLCFGDFMTPCWTTKIATAKSITQASFDSLEHIICMSFYSEYEEMVNKSSPYADCANNIKGARAASNATAAMFLKLFCKCEDFAHFDIAGTNEFKKFSVNPLVLPLYLCALDMFKK